MLPEIIWKKEKKKKNTAEFKEKTWLEKFLSQ